MGCISGVDAKSREILEAFGLDWKKENIKSVTFKMDVDSVATLTVTYLADNIDMEVFKQYRLEEIKGGENA